MSNLKPFYVCDGCNERYEKYVHQCANCKGGYKEYTLQPAFYASDLLKEIEERIEKLKPKKDPNDLCEEFVQALAKENYRSLQSLASALNGGGK